MGEDYQGLGYERLDSTQRALRLLYQQYTEAMEASRKDDLVDANKDGIPDVLQADTHALATRKLAVFLKATNPTITLGISLGDMFTKAADHCKAQGPGNH
ncbi:uncharacterized protein HaLaN_12361 [Haematococcus lacustris]|uniref:Uncharacterized protein n=1 Tax=Haematococcus lacustris TaxID=44745 RepID=A0A699Z0J5_HAELA|nr:uncharacterized protein HaLaN_12361 [Haematococcus lacustris]